MLSTFFALGAFSIMAIALGDGRYGVVMAACFSTGLFAGAAQVGLYPIATHVYPSALRATGVGSAQAWGRIGSIFGPLAGGWLAAMQPRFALYFLVFGVPLLVAAAAIAAMRDAHDADTNPQPGVAPYQALPDTADTGS